MKKKIPTEIQSGSVFHRLDTSRRFSAKSMAALVLTRILPASIVRRTGSASPSSKSRRSPSITSSEAYFAYEINWPFSRDFSHSTMIGSYVNLTNPSKGQFHDLSAESSVVWSIDAGALKLNHPGAASNNGSGFTRMGGATGSDDVAQVDFKLTVDDLINTSTDIGVLDVGFIDIWDRTASFTLWRLIPAMYGSTASWSSLPFHVPPGLQEPDWTDFASDFQVHPSMPRLWLPLKSTR